METTMKLIPGTAFTDQQGIMRRTPWWLVSLLFHAVIIVMAALLMVAGPDEISDPIWIIISARK
ncbi:MAG: hypothetical protein ABIF71_13025 [Planctomycetota bacterium]